MLSLLPFLGKNSQFAQCKIEFCWNCPLLWFLGFRVLGNMPKNNNPAIWARADSEVWTQCVNATAGKCKRSRQLESKIAPNSSVIHCARVSKRRGGGSQCPSPTRCTRPGSGKSECYTDGDCYHGQLCCFNGCNYKCVSDGLTKTFARTIHDSIYDFFLPEG